jgi:hypothetical protein
LRLSGEAKSLIEQRIAYYRAKQVIVGDS